MKTPDDKDRLLEMYIRGTDFCLSNDFLTDDYIRESFAGRMEEYGVHLDESLSMANDRRVVALGRCIGRVEINNFDVSEIFAKHESDLIITVKGDLFVMIDMSDDSKFHVITSVDSEVYVNHHGGTLETESLGRAVIKIIGKYKRTH